MIQIITYGILVGLAIIAICYTLASMFCRWAFGVGEKWEPKMKNPPLPPKSMFNLPSQEQSLREWENTNQLIRIN